MRCPIGSSYAKGMWGSESYDELYVPPCGTILRLLAIRCQPTWDLHHHSVICCCAVYVHTKLCNADRAISVVGRSLSQDYEAVRAGTLRATAIGSVSHPTSLTGLHQRLLRIVIVAQCQRAIGIDLMAAGPTDRVAHALDLEFSFQP